MCKIKLSKRFNSSTDSWSGCIPELLCKMSKESERMVFRYSWWMETSPPSSHRCVALFVSVYSLFVFHVWHCLTSVVFACFLLVGGSLTEPHTSGSALCMCICYVSLLAFLDLPLNPIMHFWLYRTVYCAKKDAVQVLRRIGCVPMASLGLALMWCVKDLYAKSSLIPRLHPALYCKCPSWHAL